MAPLIFLDFDGVIMTPATSFRSPDWRAIENLNRLVYATGAFVVISSTWRGLGLGRCRAILKAAGFAGKPIASTPSLFTARSEEYSRGAEIGLWLFRRAQGHRRFVILDDDDDMGEYGDRLVRTDTMVGLSATDVLKAVDVLGG